MSTITVTKIADTIGSLDVGDMVYNSTTNEIVIQTSGTHRISVTNPFNTLGETMKSAGKTLIYSPRGWFGLREFLEQHNVDEISEPYRTDVKRLIGAFPPSK